MIRMVGRAPRAREAWQFSDYIMSALCSETFRDQPYIHGGSSPGATSKSAGPTQPNVLHNGVLHIKAFKNLRRQKRC